MFPLRDNIPSRTTPFVNYAIIAACALVFLVQYMNAGRSPSFIERYGMIPARVTNPDQAVFIPDVQRVQTRFGTQLQRVERKAAPSAVPPILTLLTCIFLHGGLLHFLGNMWFLFIFGDNVEDRYGHGGFLAFYLATGIFASAAHLAIDPGSTIPTVGASGAIAGVMGGYFILHPRAMVLSVIPIFVILEFIVLPAPVFLGIWFLFQFFQGQGIAWMAHVGGFVAGLAVSWLLSTFGILKPRVETVRGNMDHIGHFRRGPVNRRW